MVLPAELIDYIFSFLQKDPLALKTCSKALPLYSRLAERYIYAHTVIDPQAPEVCNDILENPHLLDYPRTLEIRPRLHTRKPLTISVMSIIPRMANLVSLKISAPNYHRHEFFSNFRICLQQSPFQELHLFDIYNIPSLYFLDDAKNVKRLTISDCFVEDKLISGSTSSQLCLETLVLSGYFNPRLLLWATRWVTRLTTLELHHLRLHFDWTAYSELLVACSNSLSRLHLDTRDLPCNLELPFTFSAFKHLKKLSISAVIFKNDWALPEIIRVVNTAPAIADVILRFECHVPNSITSLAGLDWSLLDRLLTGKRPHINICVTVKGRTPEDILDALAANEALMDFVKGGLVILRAERPVPFS